MDNIIEVKNLFKSFKDVKAVQDLSITVKKGELYAFLGLNGAGKSTTISIICGQLQKDSGKVYVNGVDLDEDIDRVKRDLGVVFQSSNLDMPLTVKENLKSRASLYGITNEEFDKKLEEIDALLNVKPLMKRTFGKLSGGEKRRVDIARALFHEPQILILDEPTTGLDPQTRKLVWSAINKLREEKGITVFLTTHYMEETLNADYVVILDAGKIVGEGTPIELKNKYTGDFIQIYNVDEDVVKALNLPYQKMVGGYRIAVESTVKATELIRENPELFVDYEVIKGNMDDVFLSATGKALKEAF